MKYKGVTMATYEEITDYIRERDGYVRGCWIAHVKEEHGIKRGPALGENRRYPCPPEKRPIIEDAFKHFRMI